MKQEKYFTVSALALIVILILNGCGKTNVNDNPQNNTSIAITGHFGTAALSTNNLEFVGTHTNEKYSSDIEDITKAIIITPSYSKVFEVENGEFEIKISSKEPCVLLFADSHKKEQGYLTLKDGLDSLPLTLVEGNNTKVELGKLNTTTAAFTSENNLIANGTFDINDKQKKVLSQMDDFLSALAINADKDKNGRVDVLEDQNDIIKAYPFYQFNSGIINEDWTLDNSNLINDTLNIFKVVVDSKFSQSTFTLIDPNGNKTLNPNQQNTQEGLQLDFFDVALLGGEYTIKIDENEYFLTLPDQNDYKDGLHVPDITVTTSNDKITKASWKFVDKDNHDTTEEVVPLIKDIVLSNGEEDGVEVQFGKTEVETEINMDKNRLNFNYRDIYGTQYQVGFSK